MTNEDDAGNSHEICQLGKMAFSMNDTVLNTLILGLKFPHQQRHICFRGKKMQKESPQRIHFSQKKKENRKDSCDKAVKIKYLHRIINGNGLMGPYLKRNGNISLQQKNIMHLEILEKERDRFTTLGCLDEF